MEEAALEVIRLALQQRGCGALRAVVLGSCHDADLLAAFGALAARSGDIVAAAWAALTAWAEKIREPPRWFADLLRELDGVFMRGVGAAAEGFSGVVSVYLLPSSPGCVAGNGSMFVEQGATSLSCSGASLDSSLPWLTLAHEIAHVAHQRHYLDPLLPGVVGHLPRQRRGLLRRYARSPLARQISLSSYVGELIVHSLVPYGLLAPDKGLPTRRRLLASLPDVTTTKGSSRWGPLYDAWVTRGALELTPAVQEHLNGGGGIDRQVVLLALDVFERFFRAWQNA